jgi:regulator of protease activity HflC (stomatin/prohibitin superfamily)
MPRVTRFYDHDEPSPGGRVPVGYDPAQESLSQALRAGFNVLRVIIVLLLLFYFFSGVFQVNPGQQGLIVRFGELLANTKADSPYYGRPIFGEGWHFALPDPFDQKIRISGELYKSRILAFCFPLEDKFRDKPLNELNLGEMAPSLNALKPGVHGAMLSGDRNLSHGLFAIEYRIVDAAAFVQNIGESPTEFEDTLRRLAENVIVRTVAGIPVERIIRTQTDETEGDFTRTIKRRLKEDLDRLNAGVAIENVEAKTVEPGMVRQAFLEVVKAKSDLRRDKDEARQEANRILSEAAGPGYQEVLSAIDQYGAAQAVNTDTARLHELRQAIDAKLTTGEGKVASLLRQAGSRANEIREGVRREYELFTNYRDLYRQYPEMTAVRLWVRMREAVLSSAQNETFFVPDAGEIEIITNRDVQRQIDADIQRYQNRFKTGEK